MFPRSSRQRNLIVRRSPGAATQAGTIELMGACMSFAANAEIYGENEPADYLYKVVSGTVRTYKVLVDGRRQIGAFHLPGDIFGFETGRRAHVFGRSDHRLQNYRDQAQHGDDACGKGQ